MIVVAIPREIAERHFDEVRQLALFECQRCVMWRPDMPALLARGSKRPLAELLEQWRTFSIGSLPALTS